MTSSIPVAEGLFSMDVEKPHLIGSKCSSCGEVFFPRRLICLKCGGEKIEEAALSPGGALYSFTVVRQKPPQYRGPVPYALGYVELPEGPLVLSPLQVTEFESLKIGMQMELVMEKLFDDEEGNEVVAFKFRPVVDF
ncbi:MAG: Zn-ribbon domain-containing OB-fold protein [Chloroflexi bacterium]|nr:Zn-ribbon domain-containing OB-fold protein [Chloroflexota bacterium]